MPQAQVVVFNSAMIARWEQELEHLPETSSHNQTELAVPLKKNIADGKTFLDTLRNNPKQLVIDLSTHINKQLDQFDCQFSYDQSISIRRHINKMRLSLKAILAEDMANDNKRWQAAYQKIHGLLSMIYNETEQVTRNALEEAFYQHIIKMLQLTHMEYNTDLPDEMKIGQVSYYYFKENCQQFTDIELDAHEKNEFQRLFRFTLQRCYAMQTKNKEQSKCQAYGFLLLDDIDNEKISAEKNNRHFDIKYATTVLKKTNQLFNDPLNPQIHAQCKTLANHDKNAPSLAAKIGGALVALLGIIIAIGSAFLIPASFGASGIGIPIGTSLAAKGTAIGLGIAGIATLGGGLTLFGKGERSGLSKSLVDLANATKAANTPKPAISRDQSRNWIPPHLMGLAG